MYYVAYLPKLPRCPNYPGLLYHITIAFLSTSFYCCVSFNQITHFRFSFYQLQPVPINVSHYHCVSISVWHYSISITASQYLSLPDRTRWLFLQNAAIQASSVCAVQSRTSFICSAARTVRQPRLSLAAILPLASGAQSTDRQSLGPAAASLATSRSNLPTSSRNGSPS